MANRKYRNSEPITDITKALLKLAGEWGDKTMRFLKIPPDEPPYIEVNHYGGHYDEWQDSSYYSIDPKVVEDLRAQGFVAGTPEWGYTDETSLRITDRAKDALYKPRTDKKI